MVTVAGTYPKTPVPTADELRMLTRFGTGYTPAQLQDLRALGGPLAWFERQLTPTRVREDPIVAQVDGWYPDRGQAPDVKWQRNRTGEKPVWQFARDLSCWSQLRQIYSNRTLLEVMVDFWSDHLHIPSQNVHAWPWRQDYDALIRANALGRFDTMLVAASQHPCMLLYLDGFRSERGKPNENQGRELLELHTVGLAAGYTEAMVRSSSVILSGWPVDYAKTFEAFYDPARHTTGRVTVLGFSEANRLEDGRSLITRYLRYLARHPATAHRLATKLAQRFVSATPSAALVDSLAQTYLSSGTDIKATLRALVASPEFAASTEALVRTGPEDAVATVRALGIQATGTSTSSLAFIMPQLSGEYLHTWPRPDGPPRDPASLLTPGRMLNSANTHWRLGRADGSTVDTVFRPWGSWLPEDGIRFDAYVDHLCRVLLGRPSTPRLLDICLAASGLFPSSPVRTGDVIADWRFVSVAAALFDSHEHMSR